MTILSYVDTILFRGKKKRKEKRGGGKKKRVEREKKENREKVRKHVSIEVVFIRHHRMKQIGNLRYINSTDVFNSLNNVANEH